MYNRSTTDRAIAAASQHQQWELTPHSPSEVASAITYFNDLRHPDTLSFRRPLDPAEQRFIQNERRLSALDFEYYGSRYARIVGWDKTSQPFVPNIAQRMVLDDWANLESRALPISMQQLKARQLGVSTLTELAVAHRVQFHVNTNAVVASADPDKSLKMARMIRYCWDQQPFWMMPTATKYVKLMPAEFAEINTSLLVQAGNQFTGIARGDTPNVFHGSEICEWPDAGDLIDSSLLRAMHETPDLFLVLESTALGRGNWWHKTWLLSKAQWEHGRARLRPRFLPWFVGTDLYPTTTWIRSRPVPADWQPKDITIRHADRAAEYVHADPLLTRYLAQGRRDWKMPREQMWFYEVERDQAIAKNTLNKFLQEMPADDTEAFQSTNISAIDTEIILSYKERTKAPIAVYAITGDGIPDSLTAPRRLWRTDLPVHHIKINQLLRSNETYHFVPLRFEGYSNTDPMLKLFIWEQPRADQQYAIGVDTGEGLGLDRSVIEAIRVATVNAYDEQVAEFASPYVKALQLWPMTLAISTFFSTYSAQIGRRRQARVAIECRGNGESVQWEMKKRGWHNFHPWLRYDGRKRTTPRDAIKDGVYTVQWFRSQMMDMLLSLFDEETLLVNSPWLVEEMEALERDESRQSLKAVFGEHDDRIMALGFAIFTAHVLDIPGRQFSRRMRLPPIEDLEGMQSEFPVWQPPDQAIDSIPRRFMGTAGLVRNAQGHTALGSYVNRHLPKVLR